MLKMKPVILKLVFFSIIICSFEYSKNESYNVNEKSICLERNIIHFRNNRTLANWDNQFDLNNFYESTSNLADQFNGWNGDKKENIYLRNIRDPHVKKHKERNRLPNLNNEDEEAQMVIDEIRKELEEVKRELDNIRNGELAIQPIQNKRIINKYENHSVSEHPGFKQLENFEHALKTTDNHNEMGSDDNYMESDTNRKLKKDNKFLKKLRMHMGEDLKMIASDILQLVKLSVPYMVAVTKKSWRDFKFKLYLSNIIKI
ncbi:fam-b protein [Plasmodium chabaudi adami]|uniref:Fam-b protein n=1 Tax=Plasmodium chabaudi adami TaxID=5826 RepID=A0A1C6WXL0_PLACE|nr:fam-b protein [Plasmodium chabaudi adami]